MVEDKTFIFLLNTHFIAVSVVVISSEVMYKSIEFLQSFIIISGFIQLIRMLLIDLLNNFIASATEKSARHRVVFFPWFQADPTEIMLALQRESLLI